MKSSDNQVGGNSDICDSHVGDLIIFELCYRGFLKGIIKSFI